MNNYIHGEDSVNSANESTSWNLSSGEDKDIAIGHKLFYASLATIHCLVSVLVILGNGLILTAIIHFPHLRNPTNVAVGSLALADLLTGISLGPVHTTLFYIPAMKTIAISKYPCLFGKALMILVGGSSIKSVFVIAIDRYISVAFPLRYPSLVTLRRTLSVVGALWVYSLTVAIIPLLWLRTWANISIPTKCQFINIFPVYYIQYLICTLCIFLMVTTALYAIIGIIAYKQKLQIQSEYRTSASSQEYHRNFKITKMLSIVLGLYYFACAPSVIALVTGLIITKDGKPPPELFYPISDLAEGFILINSLLNPIVYARKSKEFSRAFRKLLRLKVVPQVETV